MTCKRCPKSRKPRHDRPGKFFTLCVDCYAEDHRRDARNDYARNKQSRRDSHKRWEKDNRGRVNELGREHYQRHKEERLRQIHEYEMQPQNKARKAARTKAREPGWVAANRAKVNAKVRRRDHHKRSAVGTYSEEQWQARLDFYGHRCYLCGCDWDALPKGEKTIEHVIPLSRGGTNWPSNLRPACLSCNSSKRDRPLALVA